MLALLANLFMGHHEKLWIRNFDNSQLLFYRRYVDDTFCVFNSEIQAMSFFEYINSQHPNIRFTMEKEVEKKLPFLDILIDISQDRVVTSVYREKNLYRSSHNFFVSHPSLIRQV